VFKKLDNPVYTAC